MAIFSWLKFIYSLWQLYPEAKKLWDDVHAQYATVKDAPAPTVSDFKAVVKDGFANALTSISDVQGGLSSQGSVK